MVDKEIIKAAQKAIREEGDKGKVVAQQLRAIVLRWYPGNENLLNKVLPEISNVPQRKEAKEGPRTFQVFKNGEWVSPTGEVEKVPPEEKKTDVAVTEQLSRDEVSIAEATDEEMDAFFGSMGKVKQYARNVLNLTVPRTTKKTELYQLIREASV